MRNAWVVVTALFLATSSVNAAPLVAVQEIAGDKSSEMHESIVGIVSEARWKTVEDVTAVAVVIKGQLVQRKGHAAHLRLTVHKGASVVADIDLRVGRKAKLDAKKRGELSKRLIAALTPLEADAAEPEAKPLPPRKKAVQALDDELPPGLKRR